MQPASPNLWQACQSSQLAKIGLIILLVLLLQIPIFSIEGVIHERTANRHQAMADIAAKWGGTQQLIGPLLIIPYTITHPIRLESGVTERRRQRHHAVFLPEQLSVDGQLETGTRYRGIYQIPVFRSQLNLSGRFAPPALDKLMLNAPEILWQQARLVMLISDPHAIKQAAPLQWAGQQQAFEPGAFDNPNLSFQGIHAPVAMDPKSPAEFNVQLTLNGSDHLAFAPIGHHSHIQLSGDTPHPSFQGHWLPDERRLSDREFQASWQIPALGRNVASQWPTLSPGAIEQLQSATVGVRLMPAIDTYRLSTRSVKYSSLFLLLTFAAIWLFEILHRRPVHLIQYLLIGAAMCLFYLLLLALAEHLGFTGAYLLASGLIISLVGGYCRAILRHKTQSTIVTALLGLLYGYLYILLQQQDIALLLGSLGLFSLLALIMYVTRHIDWSQSQAVTPAAK